MAIKSNMAINKQAFLGRSTKMKAFNGIPDVSNIAGASTGIPNRKVQGIMESIDKSIISANADGLMEAVRRSGGKQVTLNPIEPIPVVRNTSAKAFAENT